MRVEIATSSGSVEVVAEERDDVVTDGGELRVEDDLVSVTGRAASLQVRCPLGSDVRIGAASGSITTSGVLGDVRATSASGSITVEYATDADLRSSSGSISVGTCDRHCRIAASSGSLDIGRAGQLHAATKSGSVRAGPVDDADVRVTSGRAEIEATGAGEIRVSSRSGAIEVGLPEGVCPACEVETRSGAFSCDPAPGDDCRLVLSSRSGRIRVRSR